MKSIPFGQGVQTLLLSYSPASHLYKRNWYRDIRIGYNY